MEVNRLDHSDDPAYLSLCVNAWVYVPYSLPCIFKTDTPRGGIIWVHDGTYEIWYIINP